MWYFLSDEFVNPTEGIRVLTRARIPAMTFRGGSPSRQRSGVSFEARDGTDVATVLGHLNLGSLAFDTTEMLPGVLRIVRRRRAKPAGAADDTPTIRTGRDAFIEDIRAAEARERAIADADLEALGDATDDAVAAYVSAYRRFHAAVTVADVRVALAEEDAVRLAVQYDVIAAEPRINAVRTTDGTIILTTAPITLASEPPRTLGGFELRVGVTAGTFAVHAAKQRGMLPHPNVSASGIPFLGALRDALIQRLVAGEYAMCVRMLLDFLEEPPAAIRHPAQALEQWPEAGTERSGKEAAAA